MLEGIGSCLRTSKRYVNDARLLLNNDSLENAILLGIYATEEFVKVHTLSQELEQQKGRRVVQVEAKLFSSHDYKLKTAEEILGISLPDVEGSKIILESSRIDVARIPFRIGAPDVTVSPGTRLQCAYVDWNDEENQWEGGIHYNPAHLEDLLARIEKRLSEIVKKHDIKSL